MRREHRRAAVVAVAGLVILGGLWALPDNSVLLNTSMSMSLGWWVRVPLAEPEEGDVVAFPVPPQARALAEKAGIRGTLLKRVIYRHPNGDLYVAGDCGGARSFDSKFYGAVPETTIVGVYKLVVERNPSSREGRQDKPLRSTARGGCAAEAKDFNELADSTSTLPASRVDESPMRVTWKW